MVGVVPPPVVGVVPPPVVGVVPPPVVGVVPPPVVGVVPPLLGVISFASAGTVIVNLTKGVLVIL